MDTTWKDPERPGKNQESHYIERRLSNMSKEKYGDGRLLPYTVFIGLVAAWIFPIGLLVSSQLNAQGGTLRDAVESYISQVDRTITSLTQSLAAARAENETLVKRNSSLTSDNLTLTQSNVTLQESVLRLQGENSQLQRQNSTLALKIADLESRLASTQPPPTPTSPAPVPSPTSPTPVPSITSIAAISLEVKETSGFARRSPLISSGIPLAESYGVTDPSTQLTLVDAAGRPLPIDARPIAWWRTVRCPSCVQWVQVSFLADNVTPSSTSTYRLLVKPSQSPPQLPETFLVSRSGNVITVSTGAARFDITPSGLFKSASLSGKSPLILSSDSSSTFNSQTDKLADTPGTLRRLDIEYAGPIIAYIVSESTFPVHSFGGARISLYRRYEFRRGSGTVRVTEKIVWEGTINGTNHLAASGSINGVLGTSWTERLQLAPATSTSTLTSTPSTSTSTSASTFTSTSTPSTSTSTSTSTPTSTSSLFSVRVMDRKDSIRPLTPTSSVSLTQKLRPQRVLNGQLVPRQYEVGVDGKVIVSGTEADGGLVSVSGEQGSLSVALKSMGRYEPQSIVYDKSSTSFSINLASDKFWLAHHQGVSVNYGVSLSPSTSAPTDDDLRSLWAEVNRPLRLLVSTPEYYSVGQVNGSPIPPRNLRPPLDRYVTALRIVNEATITSANRAGLWGLMTWAGWPRYWGSDYDEIGAGISGWDDLFKSFAATDYYSTSSSAVRYALLSGDPSWLDELSFPSAQRSIHTQTMQCSPTDTWFYCGQSPTGYAAYRSDFNSSHQYYDNVFWYYFLTGDSSVTEILSRGQRTVIPYLSSQPLSGRVYHQHLMVTRFLAHSHPDSTQGKYYSDTFNLYMARAIRDQYIESTYNGDPVGLWVAEKSKAPGTNSGLNLYAMSIWDMENLYWYGQRTGDETVGRKLTLIAKTVLKYGPITVGGDGSIAGKFARGFVVDWSGPETNVIRSIKVQESGGETLLYPGDKPGIAALASRAATLDPTLASRSRELVTYSIDSLINSKLPFGKIVGLGDVRLGAAVAEEAKRP